MIYLIDNGQYLKIGFTNNIESRLKTYKTHNPNCELLMQKDGDKKDETALHKLCKPYKYDREWFYNQQEVIDIFSNYTSHIWKYWEVITKMLDRFVEKLHQRLFEENFWNINYQFNYNVIINETDDWTNCFQIEHMINPPKNYKYYFNLYNLYRQSSNMKPWEIVFALHKLNKLSPNELTTYLEKSIQYCDDLLEDELVDYTQQIQQLELKIEELKKQKQSTKKDYSCVRDGLMKIYLSTHIDK